MVGKKTKKTKSHLEEAKQFRGGVLKRNMKSVYEKYMRRCIELAAAALKAGELPYGALIEKDGKIITEGRQEVREKNDITRHAEIIAIINVQKILSAEELKKCTIYCTNEPCPMCSFMIRELKLKRVVFAISSPTVGGYTKWPILKDREMNKKYPQYFSKPPEIISGILKNKALKLWKQLKN